MHHPNIVSSFTATEIRCQEKSKGGLCYEVILAQPSINVTPKAQSAPVVKSFSAEDIEKKLRDAELRRLVSLKEMIWIDWLTSLMVLFLNFPFTEFGGKENCRLVSQNVTNRRSIPSERWNQCWIQESSENGIDRQNGATRRETRSHYVRYQGKIEGILIKLLN